MVTNSEKPEYFVDLATIQSILRDNDGQLATIDALRAKHPTYVSYPMTRIYVDAMSRKKQLDDAQNAAESWMRTNPTDATSLGDLMNIIHYTGGDAPRALALAEPRLNLLQQSPELVQAYVNANISVGRDDVAYTTLQQIEANGGIAPALYGSYLELALKRNDTNTSNRIIASLDPVTFDEVQALNLIELARVSAPQDTFNALVARFNNEAATAGKPVLTSVVSIATNKPEQDEHINAALATELTDVQRLRLGQACARAQKEQCFTTIVSRFPDVAVMTPQQIEEFAELHLQANRGSEWADKLGALYATNPQLHIRHQQLRLAASAGRLDIFGPWLTTEAANTNEEDVREYFYLANNRQHIELSSKLAETLYQRSPTPENRNVMIASLLKSPNKAAALPYLREQAQQEPGNDGLYLSTLSELSRSDKTVKSELLAYAESALKNNQGDSRQQLNYAYILINNGKRSAVKPIAKQKAKTEGGEWRKMLAQLTPSATSGGTARKLTTKQKVALANNPKTTLEKRKQLAFDLLEAANATKRQISSSPSQPTKGLTAKR